VVDDGSADHPSEVARRYPQVRFIRQQNQGVAAARNTGIRNSSGSFIVFLDGDDRLLPHALEVGLSSLNTHPECAFAFGRCKLITSDGAHILTQPKSRTGGDYYLDLLQDDCSIWMPAQVMFRHSVFESVTGFNKFLGRINISDASDLDFYLRIAKTFPIYCHDEVIAEWRQHATNTSHNSATMLRSVLTVYRAQWKYVKGNEYYEKAYKRVLRDAQMSYGEKVVEKVRASVREPNNYRQAIRYALVLLRYSPRVFATHASRKLRCALSRRVRGAY
jgi:glycosyltransferase involved in cell wall biosynthesis